MLSGTQMDLTQIHLTDGSHLQWADAQAPWGCLVSLCERAVALIQMKMQAIPLRFMLRVPMHKGIRRP